jgi:hypothetical protein
MWKRFLLPFVFIFLFVGSFLNPLSFTIEKNQSTEIYSSAEKISIEKHISINVHTAHATEVVAGLGANGEATEEPSFWDFFIRGDLATIIATILYWVVGWPFMLLARLSAMFLDAFIFLSIDTQFYKELDFIKSGWQIVRDIANIGFIFALLTVAIGVVLNLEKINAKKLLVNIIVVAIFINFSLFFTRVVVDASNILTRVFYSNIEVTGIPSSFEDSAIGYGSAQPKEITGAILSKLNPQELLSKDLYEADIDGQELSAFGKMMYNVFIIVILIGINAILSYVFFVVALLFLTRIITILLSMILAPLAFASLMFPGGSGVPYIGFSQWLSNFLKACFMAPIFILFLFIILQFLETDFITVTKGAGLWIQILSIILPFALVIGLLFGAKKVAVSLSGEAGKVIGDFAGKAATAAIGVGAAVATGGLALAAQGTLGAVGTSIASAGKARANDPNKSSFSRGLGRLQQGIGSKMSTSSFDWRNTAAGQQIMKNTGMDAMGAGTMFGQTLQGGYVAQQQAVRDKWSKIADNSAVADGDPLSNTLDTAKDLDQTSKFNLDQFELEFKDELGKLNKDIEDAREQLKDAGTNKEKQAAAQLLTDAKNNKAAFSDGNTVVTAKGETLRGGTMSAEKIETDPVTGEKVVQSNVTMTYKELKQQKNTTEKEVARAQKNINTENRNRRAIVADDAIASERFKNSFKNILNTVLLGVGVGGATFLTGGAIGVGATLAGTAGVVAGARAGGEGASRWFNSTNPAQVERLNNLGSHIRRDAGNRNASTSPQGGRGGSSGGGNPTP